MDTLTLSNKDSTGLVPVTWSSFPPRSAWFPPWIFRAWPYRRPRSKSVPFCATEKQKKGLSKCNRKKRQLAPGQHLHFAATSFLQAAQNGITGKVPKQPRSPVDHLVKHLLTYCISKKGECTQLGENIVMSVTSCAIHVCGKPFVPPPRPWRSSSSLFLTLELPSHSISSAMVILLV